MVCLVGAGPGDETLLTEKAVRALKSAQAIIYDNLISPGILNYAPKNCELLYAGKRSGRHSMKQEEINKLLLEKAKQYERVVRLKGGDPYIFGRGGEEGSFLKAHGIEFSVIPGVSSCFAVPAYAGIPVTHRGISKGVFVLTGHTENGNCGIDFAHLAKTKETIVFLMGMSRLETIAKSLIREGMPQSTPCAVIQNGTAARQRQVYGTLCDIYEKAAEKNISSPAVVVIGEVCKKHSELYMKKRLPLSGLRIALTGTEAFNAHAKELIDRLGGEAVDIGLIYTEKINFAEFSEIDLKDYSWIVLTSVNGVGTYFDYLKLSNTDIRKTAHLKYAVIGEKTAAALKEHCIEPDCVPPEYNSASLAETMLKKLNKDDKVLLLRAENASETIDGALRQKDIPYKSLPLYKTTADERKKDAVMLLDADFWVFASASAAEAYHRLEIGKEIKIISIGKITSKRLEELGYKVYKTAEESTAEGIIKAICEGNDKID